MIPTHISMPYIQGVSEPIARLLRKHNVIVAHSSRSLKRTLINVKEKSEPGELKGAVYKIECECGDSYVGESGRPMAVRMKEHKADMVHGRTKTSATAHHAYQCKKDIDPLNAKILASERNWKKRTVREAIEIREHKSILNRGVAKFSLSPIWDLALG